MKHNTDHCQSCKAEYGYSVVTFFGWLVIPSPRFWMTETRIGVRNPLDQPLLFPIWAELSFKPLANAASRARVFESPIPVL
jgi:hypothetical protein